jgi:ABC-type enterobactin transport system permease subunit
MMHALNSVLVRSVSMVSASKPVLWEAGHRNRAAIPNIKKEASICAAVVVKIGRKPEKK